MWEFGTRLATFAEPNEGLGLAQCTRWGVRVAIHFLHYHLNRVMQDIDMIYAGTSKWGLEWSSFFRFEFMKGMKHDASLSYVCFTLDIARSG